MLCPRAACRLTGISTFPSIGTQEEYRGTDVYLPRFMGVSAGLKGPRLGVLTWWLWLLWAGEPSCLSFAVQWGSGGTSGGRSGGGAGSGMSGALLARSVSLTPSLSASAPFSLLLSFLGLISLASALAPDHWLLLTAQQQQQQQQVTRNT